MTTTLFKTLGAATTLAGIIATTGSANAASISYNTSTDFQLTNISNAPLSVQKFDSSLGTLNSVTLTFTGDLEGNAKFENLGASSTPITVNLAGQLGLTLAGQSLFSINPQETYPQDSSGYQVGAFDGTIDFAGTSGKTIQGLTAQKSETQSFTDAQFLQAFTGTGNLDFLFSALATSTVSGSGNMISQITTLAKAGVKVTYDYDPAQSVPEPSAALGFGLVAGIGLLSQRKKNWLKASHS
jgi:hypothetical protein